MQPFVDRHGRVWIAGTDNPTLRRVKALSAFGCSTRSMAI